MKTKFEIVKEFMLDAKKEGGEFTGPLKDYMKLEQKPNLIGFKCNGVIRYVRVILQKSETEPKDRNDLFFIKKKHEQQHI